MKYWNHEGQHQAIYQAINETLVPDSGPAIDSKAGEMIRLVGNVYHERFNNGGSFTSGQRKDQGRELKKLVTFKTPTINVDEEWDTMVDAVIKAAWAALLDEPANLKKILAELAKKKKKKKKAKKAKKAE